MIGGDHAEKFRRLRKQCSLILQSNPAAFPGDHPHLAGDLPTGMGLLQHGAEDG
jgi:hypothetical protein